MLHCVQLARLARSRWQVACPSSCSALIQSLHAGSILARQVLLGKHVRHMMCRICLWLMACYWTIGSCIKAAQSIDCKSGAANHTHICMACRFQSCIGLPDYSALRCIDWNATCQLRRHAATQILSKFGTCVCIAVIQHSGYLTTLLWHML